MAGDKRRDEGEAPEDLFEDLDKFFAPIRDDEWPEGEAPEAPAAESDPEAGGVLDDWSGPAIDLPGDEELVGAAPAEPPTAGPREAADESAGPPEASAEARAASEALHELSAGDEPEAGQEPAPGAPVAEEPARSRPRAEQPAAEEEWAEPTGEMTGEEWEAFRRALDDEGFRFPEGGAPAPSAGEGTAAEAVGPQTGAQDPVEEAPSHEAVEAAAEHFAEGFRETPEDVERELLADLESPAAGAGRAIESDQPAPTWEEPSMAAAADEEAPPPTGPRNLPAAVVSGAILAVAAVALLFVGKAWFAGLAVIIVGIGQLELYTVLRRRGTRPAAGMGLVAGILMMIGAYTHGEAALLFGLALGVLCTFLWYMLAPPAARRGTVTNAGATLLGLAYVPFLAAYALVILGQPGDLGRNRLLTVLGLAVLYDICAYAVGSLWGSRPLAKTISPRKSWEGAIGATFVLLLVALAIVPSIEPFTPAIAVGLALVIAVFAPIGDLVESALKRDLGVKDMGSILPGHGGILDRIDAILVAAPAAWYFLRLAS